MVLPPPISTLFPYTTLFRSLQRNVAFPLVTNGPRLRGPVDQRSEEHTSELQSLTNLVCRLLLEKKNAPRPSSSMIALHSGIGGLRPYRSRCARCKQPEALEH